VSLEASTASDESRWDLVLAFVSVRDESAAPHATEDDLSGLHALHVLRSVLVGPLGIAVSLTRTFARPIDTGAPLRRWGQDRAWTVFSELTDFTLRCLAMTAQCIVLSTAVKTHDAFGRAYLATILPPSTGLVRHIC
jgi:Protein of unknown function (DUF2867)